MSFENSLVNYFKSAGIADSSIALYLRNLRKLNNDGEIKNLNFLKKKNNILSQLNDKKETTQRTYLMSIIKALSSDEKLKQLYLFYKQQMLLLDDKIKTDTKKNEKTEVQDKNWIEFNDLLKIQENCYKNIQKIKSKVITENEYNKILNCLIISLYTLIEPRRNADFLHMRINKKADFSNENYNYIDFNKKQFIFNKFKTSKNEGQKIIDIPPLLMDIIIKYLRYHPLNKDNDFPFLVKFDEKPFIINDITRRLNSITGKNFGSSMARHSYLTYKFGDLLKEMKQTASNMSHDIETQKDYIKLD